MIVKLIKRGHDGIDLYDVDGKKAFSKKFEIDPTDVNLEEELNKKKRGKNIV